MHDQEKKTDAWKARFDLVPVDKLYLVANEESFSNNADIITSSIRDMHEEKLLAYCVLVMGGYLNTVRELAKVYGFGATKYGDESWRTVDNGLKRYKAALYRHLDEFLRGNYINHEDGGLLHIAQVAFNCIAVMYFEEKE